MKTYPVFLVGLASRRCFVLGGGPEAERKVEGLLNSDARVTVIARNASDRLRALAQRGTIAWIARDYRPGDLRGAFLVIVSGEDADTNTHVWEEAESERVLINAMDDVPHCSFIAGSIVRRGDLTVAISTGGAAPALAVRLRERLERELGPELAEFLAIMASLRDPLASRYPELERRRRIWYAMVDSDVLDHLRGGRSGAALRRVEEIAGVAPTGKRPRAASR